MLLALFVGVAVPAHADELPWLIYVRVVDETRAGLEPRVNGLVKQALLSNTSLNVVPTEDVERAARVQGISKKRWLEPGALKAVAADVDADFLVRGTIRSSSRYGYEVELVATDLDGTVVATARLQRDVDPGKGKIATSFLSEDAAVLVQQLVEALPKVTPTLIDSASGQTGTTTGGTTQGTGAGGGSADTGSGGGATGASTSDAGWDTDWGPAGTGGEASAASQVLDALAPTFGGRIVVDTFGYVVDTWSKPPAGKVASRQQLELALTATAGNKTASGTATMMMRRDLADDTRTRLEAEEAYADVDLWGVKLRAGRSYLSWGTADLTNPTDVLPAIDYRDVLDVEKFPVYAARATYSAGPLTMEAYYLPVVERHLLPAFSIDASSELVSASRWVKGNLATDDTRAARAAGLGLQYTVDALAPPPSSLANTQAAARLRLSLFGVDASVGYAWLRDRLPSLHAEAAVLDIAPILKIDLSSEYVRRHVLTTDFEYALGKLRLVGEAAFFFPEQMSHPSDEALDLNDPATTFVLGADWETAKFAEDHAVRFDVNATATLPLAGTEVVGTEGIDRTRYNLPLAVLAKVEYLVGEKFRVGVTVVNNFGPLRLTGGDVARDLHALDMLVAPALQAVLIDTVTLRLEGAVLVGDADGTFGRFTENSRVGASAQVTF